MGNLVLEQRKVAAMFAESRDISTGTVSSLTRSIRSSKTRDITRRNTRATPLPKILRHLRVDAVVVQILLDREVTTRGEQGDPTDQAGPTGVERILPTHTQRTVVSSHA